ncbi:MAG TPA: hypothetical protein VH092_13005 [Urbifossiella sp.]|jgi:hypothetical protein|nr:hypothetical protein [Urbifossiella sp.]
MLVGVFVLVATAGLFWLAYRQPRPRRWLIPRRPPAPLRTTPAIAPAPARGIDTGSSPADVAVELDTPLGSDPDVQTRRWAEAAAALRKQNRADALPAVLRCAAAAAGHPQGILLAAEAVGFPNFPATLRALTDHDSRLAARALARAARGARNGDVGLAALVRSGLGDHLAVISESVPAVADPWLADALIEAERAARRVGHWVRLLPADVRPPAERQAARLAASAPRRRRWLAAAADGLIARFPSAPADEQAAALRVLDDLRADVSGLFPALPDRRATWWAEAVRSLRWAKARNYGPLLAAQADRLLASRRPGTAAGVVLSTLGGWGYPDVGRVLLRATSHRDPAIRRSAVGALGRVDRPDTAIVIGALKNARADVDAGVRWAAVAALAGFGELDALREFALGLTAEDAGVRHATILAAAEERVSWMWPDLDLVADAADPETALMATEALERLREAALGLID